MTTIIGKAGIKATVLADSISPAGIRLTTFECEYPRIVHSELMTHGMLSKNAASSRAIPFNKMKEQLTGRPVRFGAANPGMQDTGVDHDGLIDEWDAYNDQTYTVDAETAWAMARDTALLASAGFYEAGYAKQVFNRLTEPFQMMKTVISATEYNNFFWLRDHGAADPTIAELARVMKEARDLSTPVELNPGEWHLPYVNSFRSSLGHMIYFVNTDESEEVSIEDAIKVSSARTAAVSFRNIDYGVEKSREVYAKLVGDDRKHGSAMEHAATPMEAAYDDGERAVNIKNMPFTWQPGISHMDKQEQLWSGKLRGWICQRKLIKGENIAG